MPRQLKRVSEVKAGDRVLFSRSFDRRRLDPAIIVGRSARDPKRMLRVQRGERGAVSDMLITTIYKLEPQDKWESQRAPEIPIPEPPKPPRRTPVGHRVQILLNDERYHSVGREATRRRMSIAAVIREAVDRVACEADARRTAIDAVLAAEPMAVPADPHDLRVELDGARDRFHG
jgi:hypothetical protein